MSHMIQAIAISLLLVACGAPRTPTAPSTGTASAPSPPAAAVPFDNDFGLIFVQVAVGDAPPRTFILDSGADQTVLDRAAARALGLRLDGGGTVAESGGQLALEHARDVTFRLGGAPVAVPDVWVADLSELARFVGRPFDGILGHAVFARYTIAIDYAARRVTLHEPAAFVARGGDAVPVEIAGAEAFVSIPIEAGRGRAAARLKLDTGSTGTAGLAAAFVEKHGLAPPEQPRVARPSLAIGGRTQGYLTRARAIRLGPHALGPLPIAYGTDELAPGVDGVLGGEVLRRFTVTFDYARQRLLLEPNAALAEPFPADTSGLLGATMPGDFRRYVVLSVAADSPAAAAGLAPDDEIVAVDGTAFAEYGAAHLFTRLRRPDPLRLTVRRAGAERVVVVALRPLP